MRYFTGGNFGRVYILRLDAGDDVLGCINAFIEKEGIKQAAVLSAIGTLSHCVLHMVMTTGYPPVEHFARWEDKPLELASISGIIADGTPHLHTVVSDEKRAYAGHLEPGCKILYLGEIVIAELTGADVRRVRNGKGIWELQCLTV